MEPKQVLAKVFAAKLEYLAKKQFGFASGPWMLVCGMLLRVCRSARKSKLKIDRLRAILKQVGKKEMIKGVLTKT